MQINDEQLPVDVSHILQYFGQNERTTVVSDFVFVAFIGCHLWFQCSFLSLKIIKCVTSD